MKHVRFAILGAGPSGLAFAHGLLRRGEDSFVVLEAEEEAGGLCRSAQVDGAACDIGGGHFLDVRDPAVLDLLFSFMPQSEWARHERRSTIRYKGVEMDYPFEANLWQLPLEEQVAFLVSIAEAGCTTGAPRPTGFEDWIVWKLGRRIADEYMLPYNRKLWGEDLSRLGTYWLEKLPDVSLRDSIESCLARRPVGKVPAHAAFYYPRAAGYGEVWRRMAEALGDRLQTATPVRAVEAGTLTVNGQWRAERIVTTIPWPLWREFPGVPDAVAGDMAALRHVGVRVTPVAERPQTRAHWVYVPDENVAHHRELWRQNFLPGSRGGWTETALHRAPQGEGFAHEYAYPLNTVRKPERMRRILGWAEGMGITGLGRWGEWEHVNSDVAVARALAMAGRMTARDCGGERACG